MVSNAQDRHSSYSNNDDNEKVGTSYDSMLLMEQVSLPMSPRRVTFDVDGAVSVPPARAFVSHINDYSLSRPSSRKFGGIGSNSDSD